MTFYILLGHTNRQWSSVLAAQISERRNQNGQSMKEADKEWQKGTGAGREEMLLCKVSKVD